MNEVELGIFSTSLRGHSLKNFRKSKKAPTCFSNYKIDELRHIADKAKMKCPRILSFGSGIGVSLSGFRRSFKESKVTYVGLSDESIAFAKQESPGGEDYLLVKRCTISMPDASFDLAFANCVFNQIPKEDHHNWFKELHRVVKPGGKLVVFEHNPRNPFSVRMVDTPPSGANVGLIGTPELKQTVLAAGWDGVKIDYHVYFPAMFAKLRPLGRGLRWCGFSRQYIAVAERWV